MGILVKMIPEIMTIIYPKKSNTYIYAVNSTSSQRPHVNIVSFGSFLIH